MLGCLLLLTPPVRAENAGWFERRAAGFGQRAFQDGLYDIARLKLSEFLERNPRSSLAPQCRWLLGQSYYFLGDYPAALEIFSKPPANDDPALAAGHHFWRAETLAAMKRYDEAAQWYTSFLEAHPDDERQGQAIIGLSGVFFHTARADEAMERLDSLIARKGAGDPVSHKARIQQVRILIGQENHPRAREILTGLQESKPSPAIAIETNYWLGELALARLDPDGAIEAFKKVTDENRGRQRDLTARAWFGKGLALMEKSRMEDAANAFEQAFTLATNSELIEPAVIRFLDASKAQNSLAGASLKIRQFARRQDALNATCGLYAIGRFYFEDGNDDAVLTELDYLVNTHPDSRWTQPARLLMARSLHRKNETAAALAIWRELVAKGQSPAIIAQSHLHLADHEWNENNHAAASSHFLEASKLAGHPADQEDALYRATIAMARAGDLAAFSKLQGQFAKSFPKSPHLPGTLMEKASLLETADKHDQASEIYKVLAESDTHPDHAAKALMKLAWSRYQNGAFGEVPGLVDQIQATHPDFSGLPEALYLRAYSRVLMGDSTSSTLVEEYAALIERFPGDSNAARARFQIGTLHYQQAKYTDARREFQLMANDFPRHNLAAAALYWAGRSAMGAGDYKEAVTLFEKIPADSPHKPDARLAQIRCLMHQGQFDSAISVADSIMTNRKKDAVWIEAALRKAGSLFTLGASDSRRYELSLAAVNDILALPDTSIHHRNEAGFLKGEILQQLQRPELALEAFLDVVYGRLLPEEVTGQNHDPEHYWFIKSGYQAARMRETSGDIRGAIEIYRILERLGEPNRQEFRRTIEDLKTRHFIYEES